MDFGDTPILMFFITAWVDYDWGAYGGGEGGAYILIDLDVGVCVFSENVPIETFNKSFKSTE